ncbi:MAG: methylmalonyl-CoA mutase family protein [Saprospiraceae bacterium]|nr:methylmalonyl-CoA mutase family protein [Saprospiraceae bacterium]
MIKSVVELYPIKNKIRIVTAASLFDGHDVAINIMRRIMQASGTEVIHLGHNRSVKEIVDTAIEEDVQAIAVTSYQGGHLEFFKYMYDLLQDQGMQHIKIFGGGGGTILPAEVDELHDYGIARIYSPDDGREMGLQGMINDLLRKSDFPLGANLPGQWESSLLSKDRRSLARMISAVENFPEKHSDRLADLLFNDVSTPIPILGMTGTGGSGKSSLVDELIRRFGLILPNLRIAVLSVDPSKRKSGGALLGDRIRMNAIYAHPAAYMRSMATRQANIALSPYIPDVLKILKAAKYDLIILETSGIGQSDTSIVDYSDISMYVMTPEFGAPSQLEKIDMLDFAEIIAINKFDKRGALDALRDVRKQFQRNHNLWDSELDDLPVIGTIASQYNDTGTDTMFNRLLDLLNKKFNLTWASKAQLLSTETEKINIIPPNRVRYLSEIAENNQAYDSWVSGQAVLAGDWQAITKSLNLLKETSDSTVADLERKRDEIEGQLDPSSIEIIRTWQDKRARYQSDEFTYVVRGKTRSVSARSQSLSKTIIPRVALPRLSGWSDLIRWVYQENVPGEFPFTAGVYPFKRKEEDPTRMFAGEGGPERTNRRFHYLSAHLPAKRLSTAFDSVTLYGEDPDHRPDIYGKVGNSGVSICCLDDAKRLYSGFDLCDPKTSVSMTINGPAATICAFLLNAAVDQLCEKYILEHDFETVVEAKKKEMYDDKGLPRPAYFGSIPAGNNQLGLLLLGLTGDEILPHSIYQDLKAKALASIRGTVQADILKEDQAQNTCIFSTEFSLKLMGDLQAYFVTNHVRNFYSVSISGYHIAEAGANPITQLAFTLTNGFTYVEYYLSRGMHIDEFAPNLSFFFSNGIDPEYAVIGRVARRIWAKAIRNKYGGNERSQKLKYHVQTSGRSLHAQEIAFNDIRTTLQALYAIYDNCNSLHTNAYDEAITTPTEESVRRAVAIQMIINEELGLAKNENPMQGSFIIEELTDLVEEAVLAEFERINDRGGVLGAMETMYQRNKIQEESLYYETLKHSGKYPIIGVNSFLSKEGSPTILPKEVIRSTEKEKENQIETLKNLHRAKVEKSSVVLNHMREAGGHGKNIFSILIDATKHCSLGQITHALYQIGGQYRRNM